MIHVIKIGMSKVIEFDVTENGNNLLHIASLFSDGFEIEEDTIATNLVNKNGWIPLFTANYANNSINVNHWLITRKHLITFVIMQVSI